MTIPPPLSVVVAGLLVRPLPAWALQPAVDLAVAAMLGRHPDLEARLAEFGEATVVVDPTDFPVGFLVRLGKRGVGVEVVADRAAAPAAAVIRGPLAALMALVEGRADGDTLFFSRDLMIEGDTAVVVALRNILEGAAIDLVGDVLAPLGPLAGPARRVAEALFALAARVEDELSVLGATATAPLARRVDAQERRLGDLERAVADTVAVGRRRVRPVAETVDG